MFEFNLDFGPLHLHLAIGDPASDGGSYSDLTGDYELAPDEYDTDVEPADRIGFRGHN